MMRDAAGNHFPASHFYQVKGNTKPQTGDVVIYPTTDEERWFGDRWSAIDGVEVYVNKILYADATTWTPRKGADCKTVFINDDYDKEMERRLKSVEQNTKDEKKR